MWRRVIVRTFALNIISRPGKAAPDIGRVSDEFARLMRQQALELPALPEGAARVAALTGPAPQRVRELAEIACADDRLALKLMNVGRQAAADPGLRLDTPRDVIGWIGPGEAADIVYTAALHDALLASRPQHALARRLWQVCTAAAIWTREAAALARRRSRLSYVCGLLHDVGRPVTAAACEDVATQLGVELDPAAIADLIHEHHAAVAEQLAHRWNLPETVVHCMRGWPQAGDGGQGPRELPVVHLGQHLADLVASQGPEFAREALAADPVLDILNIGPDRFRGLVDRADWVARQVEAY